MIFKSSIKRVHLTLQDGPSRRLDYLADMEEVDQMLVSQLLPTLSARIAHWELEKQSSKPKMGSTKGMSPIIGENSEDDGLPTNIEETLTPEFLLNVRGNLKHLLQWVKSKKSRLSMIMLKKT
jgi:hypothetical protein